MCLVFFVCGVDGACVPFALFLKVLLLCTSFSFFVFQCIPLFCWGSSRWCLVVACFACLCCFLFACVVDVAFGLECVCLACL